MKLGLYLGENLNGLPHGRGILLYKSTDKNEKKYYLEGTFENG